MPLTETRKQLLLNWAATQLNTSIVSTTDLAYSAGFRRYYRLHLVDNRTVLAVDSPSPSDNNSGFIALSAALLQYGLTTPEILASNQTNGFLLVSDLGDLTLEKALATTDVDALYKTALDTLIQLQLLADKPPFQQLSVFDSHAMLQQLHNCQTWFLQDWLTLTITDDIQQQLTILFDAISQQLVKQPVFVMHADYQCRNIMVLPNNTLGLLDFQDACLGPVLYDVVSLLWDCYLDRPMSQVMQWLDYYYHALCTHHMIEIDQTQFIDGFYWAGLQRHLKNTFIFTRKWLRDGQSEYLLYLPRTLHYVLTSLSHFPEMAQQQQWWTTVVQPRLQQQLIMETTCAQ